MKTDHDDRSEAFEDLHRVFLRLELSPRAKTLPTHWRPWSQPIPALPIDEFITTLAGRKRKPRLRLPNDLKRSRLGECPYAMARAGIAQAISVAMTNDHLEDFKAFTTGKLKDLKTELPPIESELLSLINHISSIHTSQDTYQELDCSKLSILHDRLLAALLTIRETLPWIEALHLERSRYRGNLWRQSFVGSLFYTWWTLTNSDPSSSSAPFLEFVEMSWSSLSPDDLPEVNWESAIKSCLGRDPERSWWREAPPPEGNWFEEALDAWATGKPFPDL
jgi:hypothetical protein